MSQSYLKECIFCKAKIRMSDQMGKWLPFNHDGSTYECKSEWKQRYIRTSPFEETRRLWG